MIYLLDTNVISELRKFPDGGVNANVAKWAKSAQATSFHLSAVTIFELTVGVLKVERRDSVKGAMLRRWLEGSVLPTFAERILPVDVVIAQRCALLHVPQSRSDWDALIAATALVHGMTVVTRNVKDFEPLGVPVLNPWLWEG